jgi:hypothetical protein
MIQTQIMTSTMSGRCPEDFLAVILSHMIRWNCWPEEFGNMHVCIRVFVQLSILLLMIF